MSTSKTKWLWNRWHDPLRPLLKSYQENPLPYEDQDFSDAELNHAKRTWEEDDTPAERPNPYNTPAKAGYTGPVVMGPFGVIPIHESNIPSKLYNFWMCDTNFWITPQVRSTIERTPGVESLDVFTPYRFRIAVGRAFKEKDVLTDVENNVFPPPKPPQKKKAADPLDHLKATMGRLYTHWAIIVLPGGHHAFVGGASAEEVNQKAKPYAEALKVLRSWETQVGQ